jgi:hypothetical protein
VLRALLSPARLARRLPFFRLLALVQVALLARRHLQGLDATQRRRLVALARKGRGATPQEREELRALAGRLDAGAFARAAAGKISPVPLPRRLFGSRR